MEVYIGGNEMKKINEKIALTITRFVSSMYCAYLFAIIALLMLPNALQGGIPTFVPWVAQTFLQLVLLSIIMVGQDIQGRDANEKLDRMLEKILQDEEEILKEEAK